jgi:hypothetical protein
MGAVSLLESIRTMVNDGVGVAVGGASSRVAGLRLKIVLQRSRSVHCYLDAYRVLHPRHQLQGMSYTAPWRRRKVLSSRSLPSAGATRKARLPRSEWSGTLLYEASYGIAEDQDLETLHGKEQLRVPPRARDTPRVCLFYLQYWCQMPSQIAMDVLEL